MLIPVLLSTCPNGNLSSPSLSFLVSSAILWLWSAKFPYLQLFWSLPPTLRPHWSPPLRGRYHPEWVFLFPSYSPILEIGLVSSCPLQVQYASFPPAATDVLSRDTPSGLTPHASTHAVLCQWSEAIMHKFSSSLHVKKLHTLIPIFKVHPKACHWWQAPTSTPFLN